MKKHISLFKEVIGFGIGAVILLGGSSVFVGQQTRKQKKEFAAKAKIESFVASLPNWADSITAYNIRHDYQMAEARFMKNYALRQMDDSIDYEINLARYDSLRNVLRQDSVLRADFRKNKLHCDTLVKNYIDSIRAKENVFLDPMYVKGVMGR